MISFDMLLAGVATVGCLLKKSTDLLIWFFLLIVRLTQQSAHVSGLYCLLQNPDK